MVGQYRHTQPQFQKLRSRAEQMQPQRNTETTEDTEKEIERRVAKSLIQVFSFPLCALCVLCGLCGLPFSRRALAADQPRPTESDYYKIIPLPIPADIVLEPGGLEWMPDGKLAVSTRRGDIYF